MEKNGAGYEFSWPVISKQQERNRTHEREQQ